MKRGLLFFFMLLLFFGFPLNSSYGKTADNDLSERKALYLKTEAITQVPWYVLAAVDQYEKNIRRVRSDLPRSEGLAQVYIPERIWVGPLNPNIRDKNALNISLFEGMGQDGNDDHLADPNDPEDVLYSLASRIDCYGPDEDSIKMGLWDYYQRDKTVKIIMELAKLYRTYNTLDFSAHDFPIPFHYNYTYHSTWGAGRGWGGRRIHEGTDIFADFGTPVKATSYGVVELKGWNKYGGWRIGIRDSQNNYHYFAHLKGYEKNIHQGSVVKPGQVIGYVGSSGYGPKGTQGKFPPHLHYGMYKDNGKTEYSFDPYPTLKTWERQARKRKNK